LAVVNEKDKLLKSNFLEQIADIYYQQGNTKKAFEAFDAALENNPYNVLTLNNYAYYLSLLKQDLDKAERMASEVIRQQPDNATYIDTYAWVLFQKGNYNLAKFYMESAISKNREPSGELYEHYGDILQAIGNTSGAVAEWQKALELKSEAGENVKALKKKIKRTIAPSKIK
jgi:tetratricopeptide (TPR) repeat protein